MAFLDHCQPQHNSLSDDEVFIESLRNPDLFAVIVDRYQAVFIRKATDILGDSNDAFDVAQEAFVRIYAGARHYRQQEGASFKSWAFKILMNQCFTAYQKKKKLFQHTTPSDDTLLAAIPDQADVDRHNAKLSKDYLMSYISRLPRTLSRVFVSHFIDDIPQHDIAIAENISNGAVRARIHKAKRALQNMGIGTQ